MIRNEDHISVELVGTHWILLATAHLCRAGLCSVCIIDLVADMPVAHPLVCQVRDWVTVMCDTIVADALAVIIVCESWIPNSRLSHCDDAIYVVASVNRQIQGTVRCECCPERVTSNISFPLG